MTRWHYVWTTALGVIFAAFFVAMVMKIGDEQRADDARRTGIPVEQLENRITRPR